MWKLPNYEFQFIHFRTCGCLRFDGKGQSLHSVALILWECSQGGNDGSCWAANRWRWDGIHGVPRVCLHFLSPLSICLWPLTETSTGKRKLWSHSEWLLWWPFSWGTSTQVWLLLCSCSTSRRKWDMLRVWTWRLSFPADFPWAFGPHSTMLPKPLHQNLTPDRRFLYLHQQIVTKRRAPGLLET